MSRTSRIGDFCLENCSSAPWSVIMSSVQTRRLTTVGYSTANEMRNVSSLSGTQVNGLLGLQDRYRVELPSIALPSLHMFSFDVDKLDYFLNIITFLVFKIKSICLKKMTCDSPIYHILSL